MRDPVVCSMWCVSGRRKNKQWYTAERQSGYVRRG
jgi:hypothetical protein